MKCSKCNFDNPAEALFCMKCGTKLERKCPNCGAEYPEEAMFCMKCGTKLSDISSPSKDNLVPKLEDMQSKLESLIPVTLAKKYLTAEQQTIRENRPITAFFADISGFTSLSNTKSSEDMFQIVQDSFTQLVKIVANYEGKISGFRGDGLLALFGAPILHEDDAERAIISAIEMRDAIRKQGLEVTIGINTALMTVGELQTQLHNEFTAYGTGVNLAKRLQESAKPGQIIVGVGTYRLTRLAFDFDTLQHLNLKGFVEPVTVYTLLQTKTHPEKLRGLEGLQSRMIGRDREFSDLINCVDSVMDKHNGHIVTVIGEAGIGKSRLVRELKEYLKDKKVFCLEGRCLSIGSSISFLPFIDIMKNYLGVSDEYSEEITSDKLVKEMTILFEDESENIIPYIGRMLSIKLDERYQERIRYAAPEQSRYQILLRARDIFVKLAQKTPLVLILEDLHWADDPSLDLLRVLIDELKAVPILLVCVYRPEREHGCWQIDRVASSKCLEHYTRIQLGQLTTQQSQEMLESLLISDNLPKETKSFIIEKTEGNPFFVEEIIRLLIEQDMIFNENGHWISKETIKELVVPDTIQSVILSRIDRLNEEVRYVLQCASVIGRIFQHYLLDYIVGEEKTKQPISQLENIELIYKERILPELEYSFKHALIQETVYHEMLNQQQKKLHEIVGMGIEAIYREQIEEHYERLAYHYSHSNSINKAVEYLVKAGQKAVQRFANTEALDYYQQALKFAEPGEEYNRILEYRAKLLLDIFMGKEAVNDYELLVENARQSGDPQKEIEPLIGLASAYYIISLEESDYAPKSLNLFNQAYNLASEYGCKAKMAKALIPTVDFVDRFPELKEQFDDNIKEALSISQEIGDEELIINSKIAMIRSLRWIVGQRDNCKQLAEELVKQLKPRHDLVRLNYVYWNLMCVTHGEGYFEECIKYCDMGIQLASEIGIAPVQYPTLKAYALMRLGRFGESWKSLQEEIADEEHLFGKSQKYLGMGEYFYELMLYEKSIEVYKLLIEQGKQLGRPWIVTASMNFYVKCLLRIREFKKIDLNEAIKIIENREVEFKPDVMAEFELAKGNLDEAFDLAKEAYLLEESWQSKYRCVIALELQARILIKRDEFEDAISVADKGIDIAKEIGYLPMLWRIQALKAQALEVFGKKEEARQEYESSAKIIQQIVNNISNEEDKNEFLSNPLVSSTIDYLK